MIGASIECGDGGLRCVLACTRMCVSLRLCELVSLFVHLWTHKRVWVRDQMFSWSITGMVEEQRMLGYARPQGLLLCAEWN